MTKTVKLDEVAEGETLTRQQVIMRARFKAADASGIPAHGSAVIRRKDDNGDSLLNYMGRMELIQVFNGQIKEMSAEAYDFLIQTLEKFAEARNVHADKMNVGGRYYGDDKTESYRDAFLSLMDKKGVTKNGLGAITRCYFPEVSQIYNSDVWAVPWLSGQTRNFNRLAMGLAYFTLLRMPDDKKSLKTMRRLDEPVDENMGSFAEELRAFLHLRNVTIGDSNKALIKLLETLPDVEITNYHPLSGWTSVNHSTKNFDALLMGLAYFEIIKLSEPETEYHSVELG